jgi:hypothetical protein
MRWLSRLRGGGDDPLAPRMPEVELSADVEDVFRSAREVAATGRLPGSTAAPARYVVHVTPGRLVKLIPCPAPGTMPAQQVDGIAKLLPPDPPRRIAVIAYAPAEPDVAKTAKAIPFLGMLLGMAYLGHAVWIFEGHPSALAAGCREAQVLMVDGAMLPHLPPDWQTVAKAAAPRASIYVHDRDTFALRRVDVQPST